MLHHEWRGFRVGPLMIEGQRIFTILRATRVEVRFYMGIARRQTSGAKLADKSVKDHDDTFHAS